MRFRTSIILSLLVLSVVVMSSFMQTQQPQQKKKPSNLKVLPKDISHEELDEVMDGFKLALGVKCGHCHSPSKTDPKRMDFASDEKPEKLRAREMMKMTARINKKYFHTNDANLSRGVLSVSCITCHNGKSKPESKS